MEDDIRNRLRGAGSRSPEPSDYRPARPAPQARQASPKPQPAASPVPAAAIKPKKQRKKRRLSRIFLVLFILLALAALGLAGPRLYKKYFSKPADTAPAANQAANQEQTQPAGKVRLIAVGGSLAYESINNAAKRPDGNYDYLPMMIEMKPFFDKAGIRLCNQSTPSGGENLGISGFPVFNAPAAWSKGFADLGCNVASLSSFHINDKGQSGIDATVASWQSYKDIFAISGANRTAEEQAKIPYFTVSGLKFAFLSYTTSTQKTDNTPHGLNLYNDETASKQIVEARKNADLVIVSMHWGTKNSMDINADQERIAQKLAEHNVDVIIGVGPHVVQPVKVLDGKEGHQTLVWFSLGNFLNSELPIENLIGGMAIMDFDVESHMIKGPRFMPIYMHYEWTAAQKAAGTLNARQNFKLYPLDKAGELLPKAQNSTSVQALTDSVTATVTKFVPVAVIKSTDF